jgi:hypothetical protein
MGMAGRYRGGGKWKIGRAWYEGIGVFYLYIDMYPGEGSNE